MNGWHGQLAVCDREERRRGVGRQIEINSMRELHADLIKGLVGPVAEPVKNTTIEQRRRRCSTRSKAVFGRVHSEDHVEVFSDLLSEPSIKLLVRVEHQA